MKKTLLLPAAIAALFMAPLVSLIPSWSKFDQATWAHLQDHLLGPALSGSLALVLCVTVCATALGTLLAWLAHAFALPKWMTWAVILPLVFPKYVLGYVYLSLIDYAGPLQAALRWLGLDWSEHFQTGNLLPVAFAMTLSLFPYPFLMVREGIRGVDPELLHAASSFGASRGRILRTIILPIAQPWIVSSSIIVALETFADFGTVAIFNYDTLTTAIYRTWFGLFSFQAASQLSSLIALAAITLFLLQSLANRRRLRFRTPQDKALVGARVGASTYDWGAMSLFGVAIFFAAVVPLARLIQLFLSDHESSASSVGAIGNTLLFAVSAATITAFLGSLVAFMMRDRGSDVATETQGSLANLIRGGVRLGFSVPGVITAVGVLILVTSVDGFLSNLSGGELVLSGTIGVTLFALTARFFVLGLDAIENGLMRLPPSLEESARLLGASGRQVYRDIYLPLIRQAGGVGFLLVFVEVAKEMPITLMTRSFGVDTLAVKIFEYTSEGQYAQAALPSLLLCLVGVVPIVVLSRTQKGFAS